MDHLSDIIFYYSKRYLEQPYLSVNYVYLPVNSDLIKMMLSLAGFELASPFLGENIILTGLL